jgi:hypothetical protein
VTTTNTTAIELHAAGADVSQLLTIADQNTTALVAQQVAAARAQPQTHPAKQFAQLTAQKMQVALVCVGSGDGGAVGALAAPHHAPIIKGINIEEGKYVCTYTVLPNAVGACALEVLVGGAHVAGEPVCSRRCRQVDHEKYGKNMAK